MRVIAGLISAETRRDDNHRLGFLQKPRVGGNGRKFKAWRRIGAIYTSLIPRGEKAK